MNRTQESGPHLIHETYDDARCGKVIVYEEIRTPAKTEQHLHQMAFKILSEDWMSVTSAIYSKC